MKILVHLTTLLWMAISHACPKCNDQTYGKILKLVNNHEIVNVYNIMIGYTISGKPHKKFAGFVITRWEDEN